MITASHNPPKYNGYKVYWDDGSQIIAPRDKEIINKVRAITDFKEIKTIFYIQFTNRSLKIENCSQLFHTQLNNVLYSVINGTGKKLGFVDYTFSFLSPYFHIYP